ncbi:MAG: hypothetical protein JNM93_09170 [Bacteriovoracaceae bacterium]|nr:hypothetical protein [Bacteriovoracaceae bacterium]
MMPIFSQKNHVLTSMNGEVSSFYEVVTSDLESHDFKSYEQIIKCLESDLINSEGSFKLYWLNQKLYLNAFGDINLSHCELISCERPIETFLGTKFSNISFFENYLIQSDEYLRLLSFKDLPSQLLPFEVNSYPDFVINVRKITKEKAKNKINFRRKMHFSSLFKNMRDLESENAYSEAEELLDAITADNKALFKAEIYLFIKADTKKELDRKTQVVIKDFEGKGAKLITEAEALSYFYQTLIPGVPASFKRKLLCPSDLLSYLVPFHRDFVNESGMKLSAKSENDVKVNLFNPAALNYNCLVTGSSGQGKSMLVNKILMHELNQGAKAVVLDLGNSFNKNAKFHSGMILSQKFNPFEFKNTRYLKEFILAAIDEKMSKKEEGKLHETIKYALELRNVQNFQELLDELEREFTGISFYFSELKEYFTEDKAKLSDFTYCDFSVYPEAMKAPLIIYLIEYFKNLNGRKIFIFDECWHLLNKNASYIAECFRTFRKHNASAMAISQNLDDFSETQLGRVIIQNTYFKFLFKQSLNESEFLDFHSKNLLDSVQSEKGRYSEFLFLSEVQKKILRYYPSHLEYQIFTSDRQENNQFENYMEEKGKFLDFKNAIQNFTQIKNPDWRYQNEISV